MMARVLVVEDEPASLALAAKLLRAAGHDVLAAGTGVAGVALARDEHPDLVLLDLGLPDIDGWEALRLLRGAPGGDRLRVVAFTAHAMVGDRERALAAGFDGYLAKPVELLRFTEHIEDLLG